MSMKKALLAVLMMLGLTVSGAYGAPVSLTFSTYDYDFGAVEIGDTRTYDLTSILDLGGNSLVSSGSTPTQGGLNEITGGAGWSCTPSGCTTLTIAFSPLSVGSSTLSIFAGINYTECATCPFRGFFSTIRFAGTGIERVSAVPIPATLPLLATGLGALGVIGWRRKKRKLVQTQA